MLRFIGANKPFVTAQGALDRVSERSLRPAAYGPPRRLRSDVKVEVRHDTGRPVYTLTPTQSAPVGSCVYVHGGGWVNEIAPQHWHLAAQIAVEASTVVTLPIYSLVPFGTAQDSLDLVTGLVSANLQTYGSVTLAGDSAGGQIALSAASALRQEGLTLPATVLISPALDLSWNNPRIPEVQPSDPWLGVPGGKVLANLWRGDLDLLDPRVSPLFADLAGLGPITVFSGTHDVLNPDAHVLLAKASDAGVDIELIEGEGQVHVYPLLPTKIGAHARTQIVAALDLRPESARA